MEMSAKLINPLNHIHGPLTRHRTEQRSTVSFFYFTSGPSRKHLMRISRVTCGSAPWATAFIFNRPDKKHYYKAPPIVINSKKTLSITQSMQ